MATINRSLRVILLAGPFSATQDAQLTALREQKDATVEIVYQRATSAAPYDDDGFKALDGALSWERDIPADQVQDLMERLQPDVLLVASWNHGAFVRISRAWRGRALRVMIMDNPWRGTPKQWGGVLISRPYLKPAFDVVFLPNERQRVFARKLGFSDAQIWDGVYCCDQPRFELDRTDQPEEPRSFLYVGRLVREKGIDILLRAYAAYRRRVDDPWSLQVVGTGPLLDEVARVEGVVHLGFRQPAEMPQVFAGAGCFVLPSTREPWGIVLHEAASSSLPIICTRACGASIDLVRDGYNGFVIPPGDEVALTEALILVSTMPGAQRMEMGRAGTSLSRQLTPQRWADLFDQRVRQWLARSGPPLMAE